MDKFRTSSRIFDGKDDYVEIMRLHPCLIQKSLPSLTGCIPDRQSVATTLQGKGSATLVIANGNPGDGGGANWWFEFWNAGNFEFKSCQAGCAAANDTRLDKTERVVLHVAGIYNGTEYELYIDAQFKSKGPNQVGVPPKRACSLEAGCVQQGMDVMVAISKASSTMWRCLVIP